MSNSRFIRLRSASHFSSLVTKNSTWASDALMVSIACCSWPLSCSTVAAFLRSDPIVASTVSTTAPVNAFCRALDAAATSSTALDLSSIRPRTSAANSDVSCASLEDKRRFSSCKTSARSFAPLTSSAMDVYLSMESFASRLACIASSASSSWSTRSTAWLRGKWGASKATTPELSLWEGYWESVAPFSIGAVLVSA